MDHVAVYDVRTKSKNDSAQAYCGTRIGVSALHVQFVHWNSRLSKAIGDDSAAQQRRDFRLPSTAEQSLRKMEDLRLRPTEIQPGCQ
jgi:hypothetical protein